MYAINLIKGYFSFAQPKWRGGSTTQRALAPAAPHLVSIISSVALPGLYTSRCAPLGSEASLGAPYGALSAARRMDTSTKVRHEWIPNATLPALGHAAPAVRRMDLGKIWRSAAQVKIRCYQHKRYELNSFKLMINYSWRKWSCNSFTKPLTTYISRPCITNDVRNCKPSPRYYVYCCPYFYLNALITLSNNVLLRYGGKARNISFPTNL